MVSSIVGLILTVSPPAFFFKGQKDEKDTKDKKDKNNTEFSLLSPSMDLLCPRVELVAP
jgi:hypothetical protein